METFYEIMMLMSHYMDLHKQLWDAFVTDAIGAQDDPSKADVIVRANFPTPFKQHKKPHDPECGIASKLFMQFLHKTMTAEEYNVDSYITQAKIASKMSKKDCCKALHPLMVGWYTQLPASQRTPKLAHLAPGAAESSDFGARFGAANLKVEEEEVSSGVGGSRRSTRNRQASGSATPSTPSRRPPAAPGPSRTESQGTAQTGMTSANMASNPDVVEDILEILESNFLVTVDDNSYRAAHVLCSEDRRNGGNGSPCFRVKALMRHLSKQPQDSHVHSMILKHHPIVSAFRPQGRSSPMRLVVANRKESLVSSVVKQCERACPETGMRQYDLEELYDTFVSYA